MTEQKELTTKKQKKAYADKKAQDLEYLIKMAKINDYCKDIKKLYIEELRDIVKLSIKQEVSVLLNEMYKEDCQVQENIAYLEALK